MVLLIAIDSISHTHTQQNSFKLSWENGSVWRSVLEFNASLSTLKHSCMRLGSADLLHYTYLFAWDEFSRRCCHSAFTTNDMASKWANHIVRIDDGAEAQSNDACNRTLTHIHTPCVSSASWSSLPIERCAFVIRIYLFRSLNWWSRRRFRL